MSTLGGPSTRGFFEGREGIGITVAGYPFTPGGMAQDLSSKLAVKDPTTMGSGVLLTDLPFSLRDRAADYFSQCSTPGMLDPGKVVYYKSDLGGKARIVGMPDEIYSSTSIPTNMNLLSAAGGFLTAINLINPYVRKPPNVTYAMDSGARIVRTVADTVSFAHSMLQGLPSSGTLFPLIGLRLPPERNIPTALQPVNNLLGSNLLAALPGLAMSLGLMLASLKQDTEKYKAATANMSAQTITAFESMINMTQSATADTANGGNNVLALTSFRIDPNVFIDNVATVYAQCASLADIVEASHELVSNTAYHGLDNLEVVRVVYETPQGNTTIYINPQGDVYTANDDPETANTANAQEQFIVSSEAYTIPAGSGGTTQNLLAQLSFALSLLSSVTGIPPVFAQAIRVIMLMSNRMPAAQLAGIIQLITIANALLSRRTVNPITQFSGGNPLALWPPRILG